MDDIKYSMKKTDSAIQQEGDVIAYFGDRVEIETPTGDIIVCYLRRSGETPVAGDHVLWQQGEDNKGIITEIRDRRTLLVKPDQRGKLKPIAANIDAIIIVMAPPPVFAEYLIDRYIVAAELLHIKPILVLNKIDLLKNNNREAALQRLAPYQKIGYPVISACTLNPGGLHEVLSQLQHTTGVLVGPSGVGKSSMINNILKSHAIKVGALSASGAGKHTTTTVRLYHLPAGGNLIDSPGIRDFNLWPVSKQEVFQGFIELHPYAGKCRFRDCQHMAEPDCAIEQAAQRGEISRSRLDNYKQLMRESENNNKSKN